MPTYTYKALDTKSGKYIRGRREAESEAELATLLEKEGKTLILAREKVKTHKDLFAKKVDKVKARSLITFTYQLATYIDSGVPLLSALYDLAMNPEDPKMGAVAHGIYKRIEGGSSLENALKAYPKIFNTLYIGAVRAGETTGNLSGVLKYLAGYLEWQATLKSQIKQAMSYPIILFTAISTAIIILVTFVFPKFVSIFKGLNIELPLTTKMLIALSDFMQANWKLVLLFSIIFLIAILFFIKKTKTGRYYYDKLKLSLPIFGILIRKVCISRFAHTFSMAFGAGIDVLRSLSLCEDVVGNVVIAEEISKAKEKVNMGENLANSFKDCKEFPPLVVRMIAVGESTGNLSNTIEKVSLYYDNEVPKTINQVFTLLEPLMLLVMGLGVGFVAFSIFLPLFNMINAVKPY